MMKKLKTIRNMGIVALILLVVSGMTLLVGMLTGDLFINNQGENNLDSFTTISSLITMIISIIAIAISTLLTVTGSIMIFAIDYQNSDVNSTRIVWGLLSLILIGSFGLILFYTSNKNKILTPFQTRNFDFSPDAQPNNQNSRQDYSVENIKRAVEMYSAEAISKEDLDEMNNKSL